MDTACSYLNNRLANQTPIEADLIYEKPKLNQDLYRADNFFLILKSKSLSPEYNWKINMFGW